MKRWYEQAGLKSDVVISSRVRLARNIAKYPFPSTADMQTLEAVLNICKEKIKRIAAGYQLRCLDLRQLTPLERRCYVEQRLLSPELAIGNIPGGLILNEAETMSVMVNEEDHLRIQVILPGFQLEQAYAMCDAFETSFGNHVTYAFDERLGYLTECPTNLGTGLRVSAMMHLPALVHTGMMQKILDACGKMGVAVRGVYGENSEAEGDLFQISNQVTLGHTEAEILENMMHIIGQIEEKERQMRQKLLQRDKNALEDKIFRAYGVLANARSISCAEAMQLLSWVHLGVSMKVIPFINPINVKRLLVEIQPGMVQRRAGKELNALARDQQRAEFCRSMLLRNDEKI